VRAAVMQNGERPIYASFREPEATDGLLVVAVRAAALTGFDRVVARRVHYFKMPDGPFVIGKEGVAQTRDSRRIYFTLKAPLGPFGSMAERTLIDPRFAFPIPDIVADNTAAALGNAGLAAWLALTWRGRLQAGETVLILGATGVSGSIAVALAKRLGAGRVIAGGRNRAALQRTLRFGADAIVELAAGTDLAAAYRDAAGGTVDLVLDFVCGAPAEATLELLSTHGRIVLIGSQAGTGITVLGGPARRACVDVMGFAYYHAPMDGQIKAYAELCRLAAAGDIPLDIATRPLAEIGAAWDAPAAGDRRRQVLVPEGTDA
jgi:NADPH:quinone reductase-like Zn-dependent oxidoreductase